ncbi:MAG: hypothetical protein IT196_01485 [Acidimicrobiales bacterium]|nr:hypothetical protein [Acidimicrobiales bacterium]
MTDTVTDQNEAIFVELVAGSWKRHAEITRNTQTDDLLVGAIIASSVNQGWALIDLGSSGSSHMLRFDHAASRTRLVVEVHSLAESLATAKVIGRLANLEIGFGMRVDNFSQVFQAVKTEIKSALLVATEPGVITVDGDLSTGYVYAQITLLVDLDDYLTGPLTVDYAKLQAHIGAVVHSLNKYLHGRLGQ